MSDATHAIPELGRSGLRQFGITTGAIMAGLFGVFFPWLLEAGIVLWPWVLFALLAIMALVAPMSLGPVYHWWMRFGLFMSRFTTPLIMKILGKDPMRRKLAQDQTTYRVTSSRSARERLERPF
jgi:hypothetical protein